MWVLLGIGKQVAIAFSLYCYGAKHVVVDDLGDDEF